MGKLVEIDRENPLCTENKFEIDRENPGFFI
jgi:hypothetical protein